jgi:hypothetical protein
MKTILGATLLVVAGAVGAQAATFAGSFGGSFTDTNINGSASSVNACRVDTSQGNNTALAWGDPDSCPDFNESGEDDSYLWILDRTFNEQITGHEQVLVGLIQWGNQENTAAEDFTAEGELRLNITQPTAFSAFTEVLRFSITNTDNPTGDIVLAFRWDDFGIATPLALGNNLFLDGFSFGVLSGGTLATSAFGNGLQLDWRNPEGNVSKLAIYANVSAIPLPAAAWMLLAGIGGLAAVARRKKMAA